MKATLYLRFLDAAGERMQWCERPPSSPQPCHSGDGAAAAAAARGRRLVFLAPGSEVLLTSVRLPVRNRGKMMAALPFALEEQLAQDVEELHFAAGGWDEEGNLAVAVVARERLAAWLERLRELGLQPQRVIPEPLALPLREGSWSLYGEEGRVWLRSGPQAGFALEAAALAALLAAAPPPRLCLFGAGGEGLPEPAEREPLAWLAGGPFDEAAAIDLLQGEFRHGDAHAHLRSWRLPALLALLWLGLELGLAGWSVHTLDARRLELGREMESLYRETFPDARRVVNPRVQMEHRLQQDGARGGEGGMLALLGRSAAPLKAIPGLEIRRLRYREGRLELDVATADLAALDRLREGLAAAGLEAEMAAANMRGERAEGRLRVAEGGR